MTLVNSHLSRRDALRQIKVKPACARLGEAVRRRGSLGKSVGDAVKHAIDCHRFFQIPSRGAFNTGGRSFVALLRSAAVNSSDVAMPLSKRINARLPASK